MAKSKYDATEVADKLVVERLTQMEEKRGVPLTQVALTWLLQKLASNINKRMTM